MSKTIQTDVDSLVTLIQSEERISIKDAARKLGIPVETISEWASFLEEEGIINIEYKFTTPFLVKKKMSSEQLSQIKIDVRDEKDLFDRKSESTLSYLTKLESEVGSLKELFSDLSQNFKSRLSESKKEFKILKRAEEQKEALNKEIIESKQKFIKQIIDMNKQLSKEQANYKDIYNFLYNQSQIEGQILDIQEDEMELIKSTDKLLSKKLKELRKKIDTKKSGMIKKGEEVIEDSESNLRKLEKRYSTIKDVLDKEKEIMEKLLKENKEQEQQIEDLKKEALAKMKVSSGNLNKTMDEVAGVPQKLKTLMSKKDKVLKILNGISYNERMLKEKLNELIRKGSTLNLTLESGDISKELNNLEKGVEDISKKKSFFESEIKKVFNLLKFK